MAHRAACAALTLAAVGAAAAGEVALRGSAEARGLGGMPSLHGVALNGNWNHLANAWSVNVVHASRVCVRSVGGFLMSFDVWDTRSNFISVSPDLFPSPQAKCVEISDVVGAKDGHPVAPRIVILGYSDGHVRTAIQSVIYNSSADQADYVCMGSSFSFYCNLETEGQPQQFDPCVGNICSPEGRNLRASSSPFNGAFSPYAAPWNAAVVYASEVCVRNSGGYGMRFNLWDTDTNLVSASSGDYSNGFARCLQISDLLYAHMGHSISPRVYVLGYQDSMVQVAQQSVMYNPRAGRADYTCKGSVGGWWCNRDTGAVLL